MDNAAKIPEWAVKKTAGNLPMLFELDDVVCLIVSTREAALREAATACHEKALFASVIASQADADATKIWLAREDACARMNEAILALIDKDPS